MTTTDVAESVGAHSEGRFLTAEEVSRELGIAKTSVYERIAHGDLAHHRVGRLVRIRRHDLEAFLVRTRIEARPPYRHARYPQA
jgi:excisionase family DNA binding protein